MPETIIGRNGKILYNTFELKEISQEAYSSLLQTIIESAKVISPGVEGLCCYWDDYQLAFYKVAVRNLWIIVSGKDKEDIEKRKNACWELAFKYGAD
jgi:hypothetical protein